MKDQERTINLLVSIALSDNEKERAMLKQQLLDLAVENRGTEIVARTLRDYAEDLLTEVGVPSSHKGFESLVHALCLVVEHPEYGNQITYVLYHEVARIQGTKWTQVERNIRQSIEAAWDRCDMDVLHKYFCNTIHMDKGKPTNCHFINQMARHLKRRFINQ